MVRLILLGLLGGWTLTWALQAPLRPALAERDAITHATVHVSGTACGQFSEGDGVVVQPSLVITNAHVVAGVETITIKTVDGDSTTGMLVGFDPGRDVAAIAVPNLGVMPVKLASTASAELDGDVVVFDPDIPDTGLRFVPFHTTRRVWDTGRDIYDAEIEGRNLLEIRSELAAGDSGAGLVNSAGELMGMFFALVSGQSNEGYALEAAEIAAFLAEVEHEPLPTPPCRVR